MENQYHKRMEGTEEGKKKKGNSTRKVRRTMREKRINRRKRRLARRQDASFLPCVHSYHKETTLGDM